MTIDEQRDLEAFWMRQNPRNVTHLLDYLRANCSEDRNCPVDFDEIDWFPDLEWSDCSDEQIACAYNCWIDDNAGGPHDDTEAMVFALIDAKLSPADCDIEGGPTEVYEWYAVDSWMARKLADAGEVVLSDEYWGRQCTGQSVVLDGVIQRIFAELHKPRD